jgi:hypothetical protein
VPGGPRKPGGSRPTTPFSGGPHGPGRDTLVGSPRHGAGIAGGGAGAGAEASIRDVSAGDVSIGDVVRAWRLLGATDDDERRAIARTLGFDLRAATTAPPLPRTPAVITREPGRAAGTATAPATPPVAEEPRPIDLVPFTDVQVNPIELPAQGLRLPVAVDPAVLEPLFEPSWSRAIASTLTEHAAPVGPIDIERTIDLLARRLPIARLPRRDRLVSATEVVVVIDTRATLAWFRDDATLLVERLDAVTRAAVTIVESDGAPVLASAMSQSGADVRSRRLPTADAADAADAADDDGAGRDDDTDDDSGGRGSASAPDRVRVGTHGRIIGVTDLGLGSPWTRGDPARAEAWADLAIALRARGASLAIVTPVPADRIPWRLARLAPCIYWDRSTRPGLVHRLIKALT